MRANILGCVAALLAATSATAQEAAWTAQQAGDVHLAYAVFPDANVAMIARCQSGTLELLLQGVQLAVPDIEGAVRFDEGRVRDVKWVRSSDARYLVADRPAHVLRGMAGATVARFQFGLGDAAAGVELIPPADGAAIETLLTACDQPLSSDRDEAEFLRLGEDAWARRGRIHVPSIASRDHVSGWAVVTCMTRPGGMLDDCEVEAEGPVGYGFGRASVNSLRESRLKPDTPPGRLVTIRLTTLLE
ncbi:MAG: hypothetical protein KJ676_05110 [Alphaproteobacteria bacterium]|nr:hypothetical protein [Alphaproteobacteria bacterium]MBU1525951.1 hypothetical protein [Alphaproteobacteria bacterium]MBU2117799.1 hypothetical protein [Alphaproteobacteria bacterium]MBU2351600.1 hypothetical protein [Alphaproteobacteria bacterium]MBU2383816.1 hypothetical protein [Alphaproteobacteria bacterium]